MFIFRKYLGCACLVAVCLLAVGCASNGSYPGSGASGPNGSTDSSSGIGEARAEMVATDLVSALMQLSEYAPWSTTIQLLDSSTEFGGALAKTLKSSGYGIQYVDSDIGANNLTFDRVVSGSGEQREIRYDLAVNDLTVSRKYIIDKKLIYPETPLFITGTNPQKITTNDDLFRQQGRAGYEEVRFPSGVEFFDNNGTIVEYKTRLVEVNQNDKRSADYLVSHQLILNAARSRVMLFNKIENTIDVRDWPVYKQVVLRFPTQDTAILGTNNKTAIKLLVKDFNSSLHGLSITGCAADNSLLWDGTELNSLDRQRRVLDELLSYGIPLEQIRENGCFDTEFSKELIKNAVVLSLRIRSEDT